MRTLSAAEVARDFDRVLDQLEHAQEEIALTRNDQIVARLIPEPPSQNAQEVLVDIYRTLDDATADALEAAIAKGRLSGAQVGQQGTIAELRQPWGI